MPIELVVGVDLAWAERGARSRETGLAVVDSSGVVQELTCVRGVDATIERVEASVSGHDGALAFIDASLIVRNRDGQRECERQVGQRYGRWKVSANSTNLASPHRAGLEMAWRLQERGWAYHDGIDGPPRDGRHFAECFPYTALVGTVELGYDVRPPYKRKPRSLPVARWRGERAETCDDLIRRLARLGTADPPLRLGSHPESAALRDEPSPIHDRAYKRREDLIDALLCAWTALLWLRHGRQRSQVLGDAAERPAATIIAPALPEQRRETG